MTVFQINRKIYTYRLEINKRKTLIEKLTKLIDSAKSSSEKLKEASFNLSKGFTIGGETPDNGILEDKALKIDISLKKIINSVDVANKEISNYNSKILSLEREKERLLLKEKPIKNQEVE